MKRDGRSFDHATEVMQCWRVPDATALEWIEFLDKLGVRKGLRHALQPHEVNAGQLDDLLPQAIDPGRIAIPCEAVATERSSDVSGYGIHSGVGSQRDHH